MAELEPGAEKNDLKVGILYKISVLFKMNGLYTFCICIDFAYETIWLIVRSNFRENKNISFFAVSLIPFILIHKIQKTKILFMFPSFKVLDTYFNKSRIKRSKNKYCEKKRHDQGVYLCLYIELNIYIWDF